MEQSRLRAGRALALGAPAQGTDRTVELKVSLWLPPAHPLVASATNDWGASIEKASNGTIKVSIFPSEQLGKAFDHYDMARDGIADVVFVNPGYQPGRFPVIGAGELPFLVKNPTDPTQPADESYPNYPPPAMHHATFSFPSP